MKYFENFYKLKHIHQDEVQEYLRNFNMKPISYKMKLELNKKVSTEEILEAIKDMKLNKSPEPDRFTAIFYK